MKQDFFDKHIFCGPKDYYYKLSEVIQNSQVCWNSVMIENKYKLIHAS